MRDIEIECLATLANKDVSKTLTLTCNLFRRDCRAPIIISRIGVSPARYLLRLRGGMEMVAASKKQRSR